MKILVIGATCGTGRRVVKNTLRAGHEVTAFARTPSPTPTCCPPSLSNNG